MIAKVQDNIEKSEPALQIALEKVCFLIMKAKEFDAKDEVTDPDSGSNPSDDMQAGVLEDHEDDPVPERNCRLMPPTQLPAFNSALIPGHMDIIELEREIQPRQKTATRDNTPYHAAQEHRIMRP